MDDMDETFVSRMTGALRLTLEEEMPRLEEAIETGLDPASVLVGMFIVQFKIFGRSREDLYELLASKGSREILLAMRDMVR